MICKMSLQTLPILFINLGGEMMYILDQRLRAQNIPKEKATKVLHDIVGTMFNKRFMEELFKPQELYSKKAMRTVFDRLAHASIMRLNAPSMDKLYDLMTMAFKYQVSLCLRPNDVLLVTLNHMDAIRHFVEDSQPIRQQVDHVYRLLIQTYASKSAGQFQLVRQTLLNFFQDMHIRVSIFLKDKVQNSNGRFALPINGPVPWGTEIPGTIRVFNESGEQIKAVQFPAGGRYTTLHREGSYDPKGDRVTSLGTNMYNVSRPVDTSAAGGQKTSTPSAALESVPPDPLAKAQLDLLSALIGGTKAAEKQKFRLNLFNTDEEEGQASVYKPVSSTPANVIEIDASKRGKNAELSRIMGELSVEGEGNHDDTDLLDLMDSA